MSTTTAITEFSTYEATKTQERNAVQADKIHWERDASYRNQAYRYLHHQKGVIGTFSIRLLEASDLKRSYWSALAVGPVKLLGLSKAHGPVSSFVSFALDTRRRQKHLQQSLSSSSSSSYDSKPAAASTQSQLPPPPPPCFVSPVIPQDDNPVWSNCHFDLRLKKGALQDGQPIRLQLRVDEDSTAVENFMPGVPSGGDSRMLGIGYLDLSSLCTGQIVSSGQAQVSVLDTWVPIYLPSNPSSSNSAAGSNNNNNNGDFLHDDDDMEMPMSAAAVAAASASATDPSSFKKGYSEDYDDNNSLKKMPGKGNDTSSGNNNNGCTGRIRVLVSYEPHGMEPQRNDIVALEAFARQDQQSASCTSILPSLLPLHVMDISGPWLLVEYQYTNRQYLQSSLSSSSYSYSLSPKRGRLRVHRNAVFVIERKNLIDETLNLALLPTDIFMSTPLGRTTQELAGPIVIASKRLLMPALLSTKLVWMAVRTTALASLTGVHAASSAMWNEGSSSLTHDDDENNNHLSISNGDVRYISL